LATDSVIVGLTPALTQNGTPHIDGGACCSVAGQLCAVAEERLTRRKHAGGAAFALRTVLADCGVQIEDVSRFYVSTCGERVPAPRAPVPLSGNDFLTLSAIGVPEEKIYWIPSHHLSHAYAAFEPSAFGRALVLVMDDAGSAPTSGSDFMGRRESRSDISRELERTK